MNNYNGWLNLYKPSRITSFSALHKIKIKFNIKKIGHAGTLDPLAEGVLPIAIGYTTKLISFLNNTEKEYIFKIKWGEETSTHDNEGDIICSSSYIPDYNKIISVSNNFIGKILQKPPKASAVKVNGVRAYKLFRKKMDFELNEKEVHIHNIDVIKEKNIHLTKFRLRCGKGFYVRSFARDLAEELGTKGHIFSLKRTRVGKFCINNAILLDDLLKIRQTHFGFREIHPSMSMLDDILAYEIDDEKLIKEISHGKTVKINPNKFFQKSLNLNERLTVFLTFKNNILSFGKYDGNLFKPKKVFI